MKSKVHIAKKSDWEVEEMTNQREYFTFEKEFSEKEIKNLKIGNVPQEMEDKWFYYCENDTLYAYRSWTGYCIYIVEFDFVSNVHRVTYEADKKIFDVEDAEEAKGILLNLIEYWEEDNYDYDEEWLSETLDALNNDENK